MKSDIVFALIAAAVMAAVGFTMVDSPHPNRAAPFFVLAAFWLGRTGWVVLKAKRRAR
jgi:hypothetical protein